MRLTSRAVLTTLAWLGLCGTPMFGLQSPSASQFRSGIDMVVLQVTVTGPGRAYVPDLQETDFTVFEDGRPQPLAFFSKTRTPVALSLLLDTSTSMQPMMHLTQDAASTLARRLGPTDVAQVIAFDSRVRILQPFTSRMDEVEAAIRRTSASGSTSLYTAVYIALNELRTLPPSREIRRHAMVLLSDGEDTTSVIGFDQVMEVAQRLDVAIYAIGLQSSPDTHGDRRFSESRFVLRQLAQSTGGRAFFAERAEDLSSVYGQIAEELASQYTLAYVPTTPKRGDAWRSIAVRVTRPECVASTRPGYFPGH